MCGILHRIFQERLICKSRLNRKVRRDTNGNACCVNRKGYVRDFCRSLALAYNKRKEK